MSVDLTLTVNHGYDRVRPIETGDVPIEGIDLDIVHVPPGELFTQIAVNPRSYEVTEQSFSTHTLWTSKNENPYVGIPVFPSRFFRHNGIYIPEGSDIEEPADLKGKTVGAFITYQETAVVMMRGMLDDEYDVLPSEIEWVLQSEERIPFEYPEDVDISIVGPDENVLEMIGTGDLDALLSPVMPPAYGDGVKRLFEDFKRIEQEYVRETNVFPIMHLIAIRRDLYEENPWIATSLWDAFSEAKEKTMDRLYDTGGLAATLPWLLDHIEETREVLGEDYWPYGFQNETNYRTIDTLCRYSYKHGLSERRVQPEELFVEEFLAK
jgi:4,5-dihydroxyphthalate decarboxylase